MAEPTLFGDFQSALHPETPRIYEDMKSFSITKALFEEVTLRMSSQRNPKKNFFFFFFLQILVEYNEKFKPMNLVLFDDALEHLTRIHRVIRMDRGHTLLVGVGGSGKQSLSRLAAFAAGCDVFEITLSRGYGEEEFKEDLKQLYRRLGIENKKVLLHYKLSIIL